MTRAHLSVFFATFCIAAAGCTKHDSSSSTSAPTGNSALQFDYKMTNELLITKADPRTGDHWSARLVRDGDLWTIPLGPDTIGGGDRQAYGQFILHLLDTVRTLQVKPVPLSGTPASFGFDPPLFGLKWKVGDPPQEFELRFGAPVKSEDGQFAGLYAAIGGDPISTFYTAEGATLRMLDMISSFDELRLRSLATFTSDDVDEIEITPTRGKHFYAQRDGDRWTDARHHPRTGDVSGFLDLITHLRVLKFLDGANEQSRSSAELGKHLLYTLVFRGRRGTSATIRLGRGSGATVLADLTTRKTDSGKLAVFEVYPAVLDSVAALTRPSAAASSE